MMSGTEPALRNLNFWKTPGDLRVQQTEMVSENTYNLGKKQTEEWPLSLHESYLIL